MDGGPSPGAIRMTCLSVRASVNHSTATKSNPNEPA